MGVLSGSFPSSRQLSGAAAQSAHDRNTRATARTTTSLAALMSDLHSRENTVERAAYSESAGDWARATSTSDRTATAEIRTAEVQMVSGTRARTMPIPVVHLARSADASASHATRAPGEPVPPTKPAIAASPM